MELVLPSPGPGVFAARGSELLPCRFLSALCPALSRGARVLWIDAGNGFDAHGLGRRARALGLDARKVLSRVSLARPFNAYQLEALVRVKLPAVWRGEPVVLSDPLAPFCDPDLPEEDALKAWEGVRRGVRALPAAWLVLAVERRPPRGRERLLAGLTDGAAALRWR